MAVITGYRSCLPKLVFEFARLKTSCAQTRSLANGVLLLNTNHTPSNAGIIQQLSRLASTSHQPGYISVYPQLPHLRTGNVSIYRYVCKSARLNSNGSGGGNDGSLEETSSIKLTMPRRYVASLELHRPTKRNAFSLQTGSELIEKLNQLELDQAVRCVILSGHGSDFTNGVDLTDFMNTYAQLQNTEDVAHKAKLLRSVIEKYQEPFKKLYSFSKPIICVLHGLSLGLAVELSACCDIRICSRDIRMAIREVHIGIAADVGSLQLMPPLSSNQSLLNELILTGRFMTQQEVLDLGYVSRMCETKDAAMESAMSIAESIAKLSPVAVQGSKQNLKFSRDKPFFTGLDYNAVWNAAMMQGGDVVKAISAIVSRDQSPTQYDDF